MMQELLSCAQDLAQVALMYLHHGTLGNQRLLSAETIALMQTPQIKCWTQFVGSYEFSTGALNDLTPR
jgi:CubicO group peptidase (beta-lactamase class C family)